MDTNTNETAVTFSETIGRIDGALRDALGGNVPGVEISDDERARVRAAVASLAGALGLRALPSELAAKAYRRTVDGYDHGEIYVGLCRDVADKLANDEDVATELDDLRAALRSEGFGQRDYHVEVVHTVRVTTYRRVTAPDEDTAADMVYDELATPDFRVTGPDVDDWELIDTEVERVDSAE